MKRYNQYRVADPWPSLGKYGAGELLCRSSMIDTTSFNITESLAWLSIRFYLDQVHHRYHCHYSLKAWLTYTTVFFDGLQEAKGIEAEKKD